MTMKSGFFIQDNYKSETDYKELQEFFYANLVINKYP